MTTSTKSDTQSNSNGNSNHLPTISKRALGNDNKKEQLENTNEKANNKGDNSTTNDYAQQKSPTTTDSTLSDSRRIPKPEFSFQDTSSSAISDSNNQINDLSIATETDSAVVMEIKQEGTCDLPDDSQPSYAVSKIQVGLW